ncbi:MAG: site-specific integrase, partial [Thermogutta sp.]|uniref:tyrosine-type recombinase/integrase n=1 Tax=Thermogutta sp. TaxID=1962930 RepID=UPI0019B01D77
MRISQLAKQYTLVRPHQSPKHIKDVERVVRRFVEANGDISLVDLCEEHIARFLSHVGAGCESCHSLKHYLTVLKAVLNEAYQQQLIVRIPRFPKIRVERRIPDAWTLEEIQQLFAHVANLEGYVGRTPARLWWESLLLAAYYTGLRISALLSISWFQVDLERRYLRALSRKTQKEQLFSIPEDLSILLHQLRHHPQQKVWEHPYHEKWPFRALRRIVDRAGIPAPKNLHGQLFQKMRRTCITWTAVNDLNMATRVAGHASPDTTIKHYVDPR